MNLPRCATAASLAAASSTERLTGPLVDQSQIMADFSNTSYQDNAYEAVHRFVN